MLVLLDLALLRVVLLLLAVQDMLKPQHPSPVLLDLSHDFFKVFWFEKMLEGGISRGGLEIEYHDITGLHDFASAIHEIVLTQVGRESERVVVRGDISKDSFVRVTPLEGDKV